MAEKETQSEYSMGEAWGQWRKQDPHPIQLEDKGAAIGASVDLR